VDLLTTSPLINFNYSNFNFLGMISFVLIIALLVTSNQAIYLSSYTGNNGWDMGQIYAMEQWQGRKHDAIMTYIDWCNSSQNLNYQQDEVTNIFQNNQMVIVSWMPDFCDGAPSDLDAYIASGAYDSFIIAWADLINNILNQFPGNQIFIRLAHEMNGNWYAWSVAYPGSSNTVEDFIAMWQHTYDLVNSRWTGNNRQNVYWLWCPNNADDGGVPAESYYPGDDYVDWLGVDGYNWGATQSWGSQWTSPSDVFDNMMGRLRNLNGGAPIAVAEWGTTSVYNTSGGYDISAKEDWLSEAFQYFGEQQVGLISYFNIDKETDWAVFGGQNGDENFEYNGESYNGYYNYQQGVQNL